MNKTEFLKLLKYPAEWQKYAMYPDELFNEQLIGYEPGHEDGSEHDRSGAFHWWLKRNPTTEPLMVLAELTLVDPDQMMAGDVRTYILRSKNCNLEIKSSLAMDKTPNE
ncbi:hypothetical protein [Amantichitinum ursilacus]|uniref:Uncharacterized protein n=1 Tax=Amantichitinum ursilacus TaxID=857265 RepID=A0A0N1JS38_9NEIS|nr:hypothetical protein [Amantichitinum ursilacus]KPC50711.1 hypothetical protein WG78_16695 [Amantichitinum ursilacus]